LAASNFAFVTSLLAVIFFAIKLLNLFMKAGYFEIVGESLSSVIAL
jgi:hypothetical protein